MGRTHGILMQRLLIILFAIILVLLPFHAFFSTWGGSAVGPLLLWKSWKELLLLGIIPLVLLYFCVRPDVLKRVWGGWLSKVVLGYVVLNGALAIISQASIEAIQSGLAMNLRFLAMFVLAQIIVASGDPWVTRLKRWLEPWLFSTTIVLALLAIAQITFIPKDFLAMFGYDAHTTIAPYLLVDDKPEALRAFATMRGPNPLGAYLLLPILLAAIAVFREPRNILAGLALGLGVIALVATNSRSAWIGMIVALLAVGVMSIHRNRIVKLLKWGLAPTLVLLAIFTWAAINVPALRLAVFHSSPGDPSLFEGSTQLHWQATASGWQDAVAHPVGQGVGTSGPASFYNTAAAPKIPENYFVQIAQEMGYAGLALFLAICAATALRLWTRRQEIWPKVLLASFAGLTVINIFLHGWSDDPTAMTWWAIAGLFMLSDNKDTEEEAA